MDTYNLIFFFFFFFIDIFHITQLLQESVAIGPLMEIDCTIQQLRAY